jgi:hypothetical protein
MDFAWAADTDYRHTTKRDGEGSQAIEFVSIKRHQFLQLWKTGTNLPDNKCERYL